MKHDLARLYSQLNLAPGCSLEEFQRAYRRRIAELHPDRGAHPAPGDARALPELVWLYATATRFHRRHGRLPGAASTHLLPAAATHAPQSREAAPMPLLMSYVPDPPVPPPVRVPLPVLLSLLALLVLLLVWGWSAPSENALEQARVDPRAARIAAQTNVLALGMDEATVLAIQGEPDGIRDTAWDYGPSSLQFQDGRLVDWYSASQRPLRVQSQTPAR